MRFSLILCFEIIIYVRALTIYRPDASLFPSSVSLNSSLETEYNLLINGLSNLSVTYSTVIVNSTEIEVFLQNISNNSESVALGDFPISEANILKGCVFSVPSATDFFVSLRYSESSINFSSFLIYFVSNPVFIVFIFTVIFAGLFLYYCEKKQNMAFKKELMVGLSLGMWQTYQYFYKRINYNLKSLTGRILTVTVIILFSWLTVYLSCYLILNRYNVFTEKKQANSMIFELRRVYVREDYSEYFASYEGLLVKTYSLDAKPKEIVDFLSSNLNYVVATDSTQAGRILKHSCNFQIETPIFRMFNKGICMDSKTNYTQTMKIVNEALINGRRNSEKVEGFNVSSCGLSLTGFYTTINENYQLGYMNLLDVLILAVCGFTLAVITLIFSQKALFYFRKKKKVKQLLKELNSNETRLLRETEMFFSKQKEKALHILEDFEQDLTIFQMKETKCLEYIDGIQEWISSKGVHIIRKSPEKSVSNSS